MNASIQSFGQAIWQASWQASVLALLLGISLYLLRNQVAPRWRHLLWSVVLMRFLVVAVPSSPWSLFNALPDRTQVVNERATPAPESANRVTLDISSATSEPVPIVAS